MSSRYAPKRIVAHLSDTARAHNCELELIKNHRSAHAKLLITHTPTGESRKLIVSKTLSDNARGNKNLDCEFRRICRQLNDEG